MKPHTFAQMVNEVRDLALNFGASQQFRDRASDLMSKYIPIESSPESGISIAVLADVALDVHAMQYKIEQKDEEIERLRKKIAELEAQAVVVPERAAWLTIDEMEEVIQNVVLRLPVKGTGMPRYIASKIAEASLAKGTRANQGGAAT